MQQLNSLHNVMRNLALSVETYFSLRRMTAEFLHPEQQADHDALLMY